METNTQVMGTSNENSLLAAVREGNHAFFLTPSGLRLELGNFLFTDNFSCGWACVNLGGDRISSPEGVIGGNFRFVNVKGEFLPFRFEGPSYFSNDLAVIDRGSDFAVVNTEGHVIAEGFAKIYPFRDGLAAASKNDSIGYINLLGQWEFLMKPNDVLHSYSDGIAKVQRGSKVGFINQTGQWLIEPEAREIYTFKQRFAVFKKNDLFGVINDNGEVVVDALYQDMGDYSQGLFAFKDKGQWGFLNVEGKQIIPAQFTQVRSFEEGKAAVMSDGKVGFIDKEGNWVISPSFESAYEFRNDIAVAQHKGKLGYIDIRGEWIINPYLDRANLFVNPDNDNPYYKPN